MKPRFAAPAMHITRCPSTHEPLRVRGSVVAFFCSAEPGSMSLSNEVTETAKKKCPFCEGELLLQAMQCRHCRRWMPDVVGLGAGPDATAAVGEATDFAAQGGEAAQASPAQLPSHVAILTIASLGLYEFYWIWRGWTALRDETGADISPNWRTAAFLVPMLNMAMFYFLLRDTKELAESKGVVAEYSPGALTAMLYTLRLLGNAALISGVPFGWIAGLATVLPLLPVQQVWNGYWAKVRPDAPVRQSLAASEIAMAVAAGLVVVMLAGLLGGGEGAAPGAAPDMSLPG
jgi:hypothetical protein